MAALADYDDLLAFTDANTIADLLSDDGKQVFDPANDSKLQTQLEAASGQVEAACGVGKLYTPTALATIAATANNSSALLKQLVSALTVVGLVRRRPEKYGNEYWKAIREETEGYLDRLRKGDRLFDDADMRGAGVPTIDGPSVSTYQTLNLLPSRTRNFFPSVASRLPIGRGDA